jgi:DNA-binding transcriptional LysR family regulator
MSLSTDMLGAFVKVAEHSSVSAAALELGVSKSVVSKRIAQLEQQVQTTLFSRSTRRIALTSAGEIYLEYARQALHAVGSADERLRDLRRDLSGQIRVTAPVSWGQRVLAECLPDFLARHPAIEIELQLSDRLMDVGYERVDIALRMCTAVSSGLLVTPVAPLSWAVCAAPRHLALAGVPKTPRDLADHPCMAYWREASDDAWQFTRGAQSESVRVRGRYRPNNPEAVAYAARAGLGIALLPVYACHEDLATGRLVRLLDDWTPVTRFGDQIVAVAAPDRMRLARNRVFLDYLRDALHGGSTAPASRG